MTPLMKAVPAAVEAGRRPRSCIKIASAGGKMGNKFRCRAWLSSGAESDTARSCRTPPGRTARAPTWPSRAQAFTLAASTSKPSCCWPLSCFAVLFSSVCSLCCAWQGGSAMQAPPPSNPCGGCLPPPSKGAGSPGGGAGTKHVHGGRPGGGAQATWIRRPARWRRPARRQGRRRGRAMAQGDQRKQPPAQRRACEGWRAGRQSPQKRDSSPVGYGAPALTVRPEKGALCCHRL